MGSEHGESGAMPPPEKPKPWVEKAHELLEEAEVVDEPTAEVPKGFNLSKVMKLRSETPEEIEAKRRQAEGPGFYRTSGGARPRVGDVPINDGGGKRKRV